MDFLEKIDLLTSEQKDKLLEVIDAWLDDEDILEPSPPKHRLYPLQLSYSVEDIKGIVNMFSRNKKWTYEDLENEAIFPPNLRLRVYLINYKIYIMDPKPLHQEVLGNVFTFLNLYIKQHKLGKAYPAPVSLHISEGTCLKPDIVLVLKPNLDKMTDKGMYEPPTLAVEVISRANYKKLREAKKQQYADFGIPEYWEIYPTQKKINIEVLEEDEEGKKSYTLFSTATKVGKATSKILEGFELSVADTFDMEE